MANPNGAKITQMGPLVTALARYGQYGAQLFQPPNDSIRGIDPSDFDSPLQPIQPIAPRGAEARAFQWSPGQNQTITPRPDAEYTAAQLKVLATYPLARICIENVKNDVAGVPWEIQPRKNPGETKKEHKKRIGTDKQLIAINRFFERPTRMQNYVEWVKDILEDMLVIDAASILLRRQFNGKLVEMPVLRGESIVRYIDENGYTPLPPSAAYAQNWWGLPFVALRADQLVYKPRNIVPRNTISSQLYGMPPTEQLAPEIEIGQQRLAFTLAYYTEGSTPGVMQVAPKGTPPEKVQEAMMMLNSELAGNLAKRRQHSIIQGFGEPGKEQIIFTKEPLLADAFDDKHIRMLAFGYGTSPQRLLRMMNRASSESNQDAAEEEGSQAYLTWLKGIIDHILFLMGNEDYEFILDPSKEPDPEKNMSVVSNGCSKALFTLNEGRDKLGEEPSDDPNANVLGVITPQGFISLEDSIAAGKAAAQQATKLAAAPLPKPGENNPNHPNGGPPNSGKGEPGKNDSGSSSGAGATAPKNKPKGEPANKIAAGTSAGTISKSSKHTIHPGRSHPNSIVAKHKLEKALNSKFKPMLSKCAKAVRRAVQKSAETGTLAKADKREATLKAILKSLGDDWKELSDSALDALVTAATTGASTGALQLDISDEDLIGTINEVAKAWAEDRAAELVGMKRNTRGKLVDNPNAKMAITDTTRDKLREVIAEAFEKESSMAEIVAKIQDTGAFSEARAQMIAKTEIARAQTQGNLDSWKTSGMVKTVEWQLSADHDDDDECDENADNSPYDLDDVPDFPAHPNCMCALVLGELEEE